MPEIKLSELVRPQSRQQAFLDAVRKHRFVLYGGAAGGGKSYILRWWLVLFLLHAYFKYGVRNVRVGLFCETYTALKDRQISKITDEFPKWLGDYVTNKALGEVFRLKDCFGGGYIALRNLDDPNKYDSVEFAAIAVDELTKNREAIFDALRKRLRWPSVPGQPSFPAGFKFPFAASTNPGGVGHAWVKKLWIDRQFPSWLEPYADEFCFVPALASDNRYLPDGYYDGLKSLEPKLAKAYAEGSWDTFEGMYFEEWNPAYHVCEPFDIPRFWTRFCAADWGYSPDPFANLWFAVAPDKTVYVYRECGGNKKTPAEWATVLNELSEGEELEYKKLDPSTWGTKLKAAGYNTGVSIAEDFQNHGWQVAPADNDRINGWTRLHDYLRYELDENGELIRKPKLQIFTTCKELIRTLPTLTHDEFKQADVARKGLEDHYPDALRYGLMSRPPLSIEPLEDLAREWQDAHRRAEHLEQAI